MICLSASKVRQWTDTSLLGKVAQKGAAAIVVQEDVEAPEGVTVIKVEDTRYALALLSAAYFDHPAGENACHRCNRN